MAYKNPVPFVDGSEKFKIKTTFTFEECVTREDAVKGITEVILNAIKENEGMIPISWIDFAK